MSDTTIRREPLGDERIVLCASNRIPAVALLAVNDVNQSLTVSDLRALAAAAIDLADWMELPADEAWVPYPSGDFLYLRRGLWSVSCPRYGASPRARLYKKTRKASMVSDFVADHAICGGSDDDMIREMTAWADSVIAR